ncbi:Serine/threonine-protein kinase pkn1 [Maioricimonas rarisocia]|uniref:Serine/threonine-protein kinase pkn1 n=1 Tax=Maioricimonas rarisocia TaxID=2528026 RepID=A0A517Z829_9PLAN|nr:formylglycine-generating enzyme family protein [Maioricimonas rarisocia]QDU38637.1 Serine/threonine-protein kinase pkn1 [Maioricimonas rarisocia]
MRILIGLFLGVVATGCGASAPDLADVKEQMNSEQRALGDPFANSVGMVFVPIPAGEFQMGSDPPKDPKKNVPGAETETPRHKVTITRPFYLAICEVTQKQYETVTGERPWEEQPLVVEGENYAASYISWEKAVEFCRKLSELENASYRLPTEAEWEYACRAGTEAAWSFGDDGRLLADYGWFDANAYQNGEQYPHAVGQKLPNAWVLYDMHGNVWEWCQDRYGDYGRDGTDQTDPQGAETGRLRVWRGGGFNDAAVNTRSATRLSYGRRDYRPEFAAGFRVLREWDAP